MNAAAAAKWRPVELTRRMWLSPRVQCLVLRKADRLPFSWSAGQYVEVCLPGDFEGRAAYSIASPVDPTRPGEFEIAIKATPSNSLARNVRPGGTVFVRGPNGSFAWRPPAQGGARALLVATGVGAAPIRAIIQEQCRKETNASIVLLLGCRTEQDLLWGSELWDLARRDGRFRFEPTLSRPGPKWSGRYGYVQTQLESVVSQNAPACAYVCGHREMVADCTRSLRSLGVGEVVCDL
jgi:CDP-4-dehydro-6-deoxyglucose reductase, E3